MTVFIDDMFKYPMGRFGRMKMSHMVATTEEELHAMADKIGVQRKWYQGDHYDVAQKMRNRAIEKGAVAVTMRQLGTMVACRRRTGILPEPITEHSQQRFARAVIRPPPLETGPKEEPPPE
jgi:hypothetical protein